MSILNLSKLFFLNVVLFCFSNVAFSEDESSYKSGYLGARLGHSYNDNSCMNTNITCDKDEAGYGVFAGYEFNRRAALELSFNDIGDSVAKYPDMNLEGKLRETDLAVKLSYPLYMQARIYGKFGAAYWTGEVTGGPDKLDDSGVSPLIGAGVEVPFADNWTARLEYQYIHQVGNDQMGESNPNFLGISLVWNFASRKHNVPVVIAPVAIVATPLPVAVPEPVHKSPEPSAKEQRIVVDEQLGGPLFDFDKATIRNTASIDPVVNLLMKTPSLDVSIIGHTDARGDSEYNQRLSETRANVVAKYLRSKGVTLNRIKVFGMGEDQPVADNQTEEGRAKNRRVEFVISDTKTP